MTAVYIDTGTAYYVLPRSDIRFVNLKEGHRAVQVEFLLSNTHSLVHLEIWASQRPTGRELNPFDAEEIVENTKVARAIIADLKLGVEVDVTWTKTDGEWTRTETRPA